MVRCPSPRQDGAFEEPRQGSAVQWDFSRIAAAVLSFFAGTARDVLCPTNSKRI
ncbi:MAG: hypothetical protein KBI46_08335 [Phycisphaerae bacterium]|nr:hypothetical protein [Phycisphaerae bacterium]